MNAFSDDESCHQEEEEEEEEGVTDVTDSKAALSDASSITLDGQDGKNLGFGSLGLQSRPEASLVVGRDSENYNMSHSERGVVAIFAHESYDYGGPPRRLSTEQDTESCVDAFKHLGYEVRVFKNLRKKAFMDKLEKLADEDHSKRDSIVVVVMTHGGVEEEREFIWTFDDKLKTCAIWSSFTADKSPTLAGKPKLFFIQACRGEKTDAGIKITPRAKGLMMETDSLPIKRDYVIPVHADILIMWATYPGMFAFKTQNNGIRGSVFIHFLNDVLGRAKKGDELFPLLLRVTRKVAIEYESHIPLTGLDHKKQAPYMASTLTRRVFFT